MVTLDVAPDRATQRDRADWRAWLACGLATLSAASCALALALPYYAAGLHHRPAGESLYLHELAGLWPYTSALGPLVGLLAWWALAFAPFVSAAVMVWCAHRLWKGGGGRVVVVAALLLSAATLAWLTTPLAGELMAWMID